MHTADNPINYKTETHILRVSLARCLQAIAAGEYSNSTPMDFGNLSSVVGKGASELYALAENHDRGWNALAALVIHEIQHLQMMLELERKEKYAMQQEIDMMRDRIADARAVLYTK